MAHHTRSEDGAARARHAPGSRACAWGSRLRPRRAGFPHLVVVRGRLRRGDQLGPHVPMAGGRLLSGVCAACLIWPQTTTAASRVGSGWANHPGARMAAVFGGDRLSLSRCLFLTRRTPVNRPGVLSFVFAFSSALFSVSLALGKTQLRAEGLCRGYSKPLISCLGALPWQRVRRLRRPLGASGACQERKRCRCSQRPTAI